jgi:transcriptional regulator with XRE-family HTH domain
MKQSVGADFKKLRREMKCRQNFAENIGISQTVVSRVEKSQRDAKVGTLLTLLGKLGVSPKEFFEDYYVDYQKQLLRACESAFYQGDLPALLEIKDTHADTQEVDGDIKAMLSFLVDIFITRLDPEAGKISGQAVRNFNEYLANKDYDLSFHILLATNGMKFLNKKNFANAVDKISALLPTNLSAEKRKLVLCFTTCALFRFYDVRDFDSLSKLATLVKSNLRESDRHYGLMVAYIQAVAEYTHLVLMGAPIEDIYEVEFTIYAVIKNMTDRPISTTYGLKLYELFFAARNALITTRKFYYTDHFDIITPE